MKRKKNLKQSMNYISMQVICPKRIQLNGMEGVYEATMLESLDLNLFEEYEQVLVLLLQSQLHK